MNRPKNPHLRAVIEIGFIVFLFYSNLLMGEFTATTERGKTLAFAVADIFTVKNFGIALVTAIVGHLGLVSLREKS